MAVKADIVAGGTIVTYRKGPFAIAFEVDLSESEAFKIPIQDVLVRQFEEFLYLLEAQK